MTILPARKSATISSTGAIDAPETGDVGAGEEETGWARGEVVITGNFQLKAEPCEQQSASAMPPLSWKRLFSAWHNGAAPFFLRFAACR
jgi:hypothetical protein